MTGRMLPLPLPPEELQEDRMMMGMMTMTVAAEMRAGGMRRALRMTGTAAVAVGDWMPPMLWPECKVRGGKGMRGVRGGMRVLSPSVVLLGCEVCAA